LDRSTSLTTLEPDPADEWDIEPADEGDGAAFPDQKNDRFCLQSDLRYIWKSWAVTLSYLFEKWD
jgi:hypothetical protein